MCIYIYATYICPYTYMPIYFLILSSQKSNLLNDEDAECN